MTAGTLTAAAREQAGTRIARADVQQLALVTVQLVLALLVVRTFQLESRTFYNILLLAAGGFLVSALLPLRFRQAWFVAVSFTGIGVAFGVAGGVWLVGAGLCLIAICHLPIAFRWRVVGLLAAAGGLALMRAGKITSPWPLSIWPILGSMFMFRLIMYMYSLRFDNTPPKLSRTLAYFFMLPNVAFPLFPLVDYGVFARTYYETGAFRIYQRGVKWIARGMLHLLLYRLVYYHLVMQPADITSLGGLLQHFASTFLLYLRVSGQFHIAVGMLHLFGFHLPETHHLYYLSSSFTDLWRRTNIYWKDFIMKYVYYPAYFRTRRLGPTTGVVISMGVVFVLTWLFHSYQWFWLRGSFPLTATDGLFWFVMTAFLLVAVLKETRQGRRRTLITEKRWRVRRGLAAVAMFAIISMLWTLWDSSSVRDFLSLFQVATRVSLKQLLAIGGIVGLYLGIAGWPWGVQTLAERQNKAPKHWWRQSSLQTMALLAGLLALGNAWTREHLLNRTARQVMVSLQESRLNDRDAAMLQRGYYEQLMNVERYNNQLWDMYRDKPPGWVGATKTDAYHALPTLLGGELKPLARLELKDALFSTNRWGMRDRDYTLEKPVGTVRLALLGPSDVMGSGVTDSQTFENVVERRLNREAAADSQHYEILNFSVAAFSLVQQAVMLEERVWKFDPDAVAATYHPGSDGRVAYQHLAKSFLDNIPIHDATLNDIIRRSGVHRGDVQPVVFRKLRPYSREIEQWCFHTIASAARAHGVPALLLVVDPPGEPSRAEDPMLPIARREGLVIADIRDAYGSHDLDSLMLAEWDEHPSAEAHHLMAQRMYQELKAHPEFLRPHRPEEAGTATPEGQ